MKFLKKTKIFDQSPIDYQVIRDSIRGIKKLLSRLKHDTYHRSRTPDYVIKREEKMNKLQLIIVDLKRLL